MKAFGVVILMAAFAFGFVGAQRVNTLRPGNLAPVNHIPDFAGVDVAEGAASDRVKVASYDKPLRSLRETFFVTNNSATDTLTVIRLSLTYFAVADSSMLHSRRASVSCYIPPLQTRQLYLIAWDRQYTYYSENTRIRPSGTRAVPYCADIRIEGATFKNAGK